MHYFLYSMQLIVAIILIINMAMGLVLVYLTIDWHLKLKKLDNKFTSRAEQQDYFINTLSCKIAAFEITGKVKKI